MFYVELFIRRCVIQLCIKSRSICTYIYIYIYIHDFLLTLWFAREHFITYIYSHIGWFSGYSHWYFVLYGLMMVGHIQITLNSWASNRFVRAHQFSESVMQKYQHSAHLFGAHPNTRRVIAFQTHAEMCACVWVQLIGRKYTFVHIHRMKEVWMRNQNE